MSNSSLISYTKISPNRTSPRNHVIDTITIHCMAGNMSLESCGNLFAKSSTQASSNYGIDSNGKIAMYVEEKDRSWCSSNAANDNRAITIEVANDGGANTGWHVSNKAYAALIDLCVDICQRNNIKELKWKGDKSLIGQIDKQNMTVHRWFANKSCPGDYLYNLHDMIAAEVNKRLRVDNVGILNILNHHQITSNTVTVKNFPKVPFTVEVKISDLNIRKGPGTNYDATGRYTGKGTFTITKVQKGWGKLKSGAGWILLENPSYCTIKGTQTTAKKSIEEIAKEVIQGKWGNGSDRKKNLETAGYNYAQVQATVNRLCK